MKIIELESRDNWKIKNLSKLKLKKYRHKEGKFMVENWKIIQSASAENIYFSEIFVTKNFLARNKDKLEEIFGKEEERFLFLVSEKLIRQISSLKNPEGVLAVYRSEDSKLDLKGDVVYLDSISDPGNLGTILRSALAFGFEEVVLSEECVDIYNPKVIQAAKDAIFKLKLVFDSRQEVLGKIKKAGLKILVTDVQSGEELEVGLRGNDKVCLILGNESQGVSEELLSQADAKVNIKTTNKIESLNVAVGAGILFDRIFSFRRGCKRAGER
ncbi:MAG: RNA methyltransferase [Candidatus Moraniibacteriota bacterium]